MPADAAAPQNTNIRMVDSFLKNLKKKNSSKSRARRECVSAVNCTQSPKRKRSKSNRSKSKKSRRSQGLQSLSFDIRERENYNRKLDETVQRILDREREYLEEQLLREKKENRAKDALVTSLKADLAQLQVNFISNSNPKRLSSNSGSRSRSQKRKRSANTSRGDVIVNIPAKQMD